MITKHIFLLTFLMAQACSIAWAQLSQPRRLEIPIDDQEWSSFNVVSAEDQGIVLYREVRNRETRMERKYQVILVDTTLNKQWENNFYIHLKYIQIGYEYAQDYFYMLFQRNLESLKADLFVLRINLESQAAETFLIERDYPMELSEFEVVGNTLIFGGYSNNIPAIITYEFGNAPVKVLPGFFNERSSIQHLETDDDLRTFNVLVDLRTNDGRKTLAFKSFNENGELLKSTNLLPADEKSLLFGRAISLDSNIDLIVGTYTRKRSDLSRGIFLARIEASGDQIINYYNYADLKNFFSYMKAKREKEYRSA
jgi:hypothetical protein